jgi:Lrp/AsnC family transcriptional regulator, leucine-responsive regulatory protein
MSNILALDPLDRRLLAELDRNAQLSFAELSRRLRTPQETVRYRVNALQQQGVISTFFAIIDPGKFGAEVHKVLIKCRNVDEPQLEKILRSVVTHPTVNWVVRFDGLYDIGFTIWVQQIRELSDFIDELRSRYHKHIHRISFAINLDVEFFPRLFGTRPKRSSEERSRYTSPHTPIAIDHLDRQILRALAENPRTNATDISRAVGVTSETIHNRIKKLERGGVVTGYRLVINNALLGEQNFYTLVYFQSTSKRRLAEFGDYCRRHPAISGILKVLAEWDYELNIEVQTIAEYRTLMMDLTREFSDVVREYYSLSVNEIRKFRIMPEGI